MRHGIYFVTFFLLPSLGFLTHEVGHFLSAKCYNLESPTLHYSSTSFWEKETESEVSENSAALKTRRLVVAGSGPVATLFLGITASLLFLKLYSRNASFLAVTISLAFAFSLVRFPVTLLQILLDESGKLFLRTDEYKMAESLSINPYIFTGAFTLISTALLLICFFRLKKNDKITFLYFGVTGGLSGYFFWLFFLGPKIMP